MTIPPDRVLDFLEELDIRKFYGVGKVTAEKMYRLGIFKGRDLKAKTLVYLVEHFGKSGRYYFEAVRGIHRSEVKPDRIPKSVGAERTFGENISSEVYLMQRLEAIAEELEKRLLRNNISGKTVTLKIRYGDFTLHTRSKTVPHYIQKKEAMLQHVEALLYQDPLQDSVRLLGISLSNLNTGDRTGDQEDSQATISEQLKFDF